MILLSGFATCPGLFYATSAQDGILSRIRIPGGILSSQQCYAIADIAEYYGGGYVDVTNRANLQVREIHTGINATILKHLQDVGLGSRNPAVDHIRNIMASPTAGIDPQELIDTRPLVQSWDNHIAENSALSKLSAKFSVGFDGGGKVSVSDRLNDIMFAAVLCDNKVYFRLCLSYGAPGKPPIDAGILLLPEQCLPVLVALADVYLSYNDPHSQRKLRLRELLNSLGCETYLHQVTQRLCFPVLRSYPNSWQIEELSKKSDNQFGHIGIHPQYQPGLFYIGVILPLGRLESWQIRGLANLAEKYGSGTLRLTPWQNLLLTDITQESLAHIQHEITKLKLDFSPRKIKSALVACSGSRGCAASATDTKVDALTLAENLENNVSLNHPINIHFSGCEKSCAQHNYSDITLLGVSLESENGNLPAYHIYIGNNDSNHKFGYQVYQYVNVTELPMVIRQILQVYKIKSKNPDESFREFVNGYEIDQLKQLFS